MVPTEKDLDRILALRRSGYFFSKIAAELGFSTSSLSRFLRSRGITGRNFDYFGALTDRQWSVLVGTLLGDGCLALGRGSGNPSLRWNHCLKQRDYLVWKAQEFGALFNKHDPAQRVVDGYDVVSLCSREHPVFLDAYGMFYGSGRKIISEEILAKVDDLALAVWFGDDGSLGRPGGGRRSFMRLFLGGVSDSECRMVENWFRRMGYTPTYIPVPGKKVVELSFHADESVLLRQIVLDQLPPCIHFKFEV